MLMADREEVVHNLCVQVTWYTLESTRLPEDLGYLAGDWYVEELSIRKREERMMVRLMKVAGTGIKLMLRPGDHQGPEHIRLRSPSGVHHTEPACPTAPDAKSYVAVSHSSIPHTPANRTPANHAAVSQTEVPQNATDHNAGSHREVSHGVASHDAVHPIIVSHTMDSRTANSQAAFCPTARSHLHV